MKILILAILAISLAFSLASCNSSSGGGGGNSNPLSEATKSEKAMLGEEIDSLLTLLYTLEAKIYDISDEVASKPILDILKVCKSSEDSTGDEFNGTYTYQLGGALCPVTLSNTDTWEDVNQDNDIDNLSSALDYTTNNSAIIQLIDIAKLNVTTSFTKESVFLQQTFQFISLVNGQISGRQFTRIDPADGDDIKVTQGIDINIQEQAYTVRAIYVGNFESDPSVIKSVKYYINGYDVTPKEFEQIFPIFSDLSKLDNNLDRIQSLN